MSSFWSRFSTREVIPTERRARDITRKTEVGHRSSLSQPHNPPSGRTSCCENRTPLSAPMEEPQPQVEINCKERIHYPIYNPQDPRHNPRLKKSLATAGSQPRMSPPSKPPPEAPSSSKPAPKTRSSFRGITESFRSKPFFRRKGIPSFLESASAVSEQMPTDQGATPQSPEDTLGSQKLPSASIPAGYPFPDYPSTAPFVAPTPSVCSPATIQQSDEAIRPCGTKLVSSGATFDTATPSELPNSQTCKNQGGEGKTGKSMGNNKNSNATVDVTMLTSDGGLDNAPTQQSPLPQDNNEVSPTAAFRSSTRGELGDKKTDGDPSSCAAELKVPSSARRGSSDSRSSLEPGMWLSKKSFPASPKSIGAVSECHTEQDSTFGVDLCRTKCQSEASESSSGNNPLLLPWLASMEELGCDSKLTPHPSNPSELFPQNSSNERLPPSETDSKEFKRPVGNNEPWSSQISSQKTPGAPLSTLALTTESISKRPGDFVGREMSALRYMIEAIDRVSGMELDSNVEDNEIYQSPAELFQIGLSESPKEELLRSRANSKQAERPPSLLSKANIQSELNQTLTRLATMPVLSVTTASELTHSSNHATDGAAAPGTLPNHNPKESSEALGEEKDSKRGSKDSTWSEPKSSSTHATTMSSDPSLILDLGKKSQEVSPNTTLVKPDNN